MLDLESRVTADSLLAAIREKRVAFFVGSGVSIGYPACLPGVRSLLKCGASLFLPAGTVAPEGLWPEVFYHEATAFVGGKALTAFDVLAQGQSMPTASHYAIVSAAIGADAPIITTNFDQLLEQAALEVLGRKPVVVGPAGPFGQHVRAFSIWKVHGTVGDDILSTMPRITQPNRELLAALGELTKEWHLCFVGYSGSDIDLFPMIQALSEKEGLMRPFWIDPSLEDQVLRRRAASIEAAFIGGTLDEVMDFDASKAENGESVLGRSTIVAPAPTISETELREIVKGKLSSIATDATLQRLMSDEQKHLLYSICLMRVGKPAPALDHLLSRPDLKYRLEREDRALLALTKARLADCLSDYDAAEEFARVGLRELRSARANKSCAKRVALRLQAYHALSMAKKMQLGPIFAYGNRDIDFKPRKSGALNVLLRYIWTGARMRWLLHSGYRYAERVDDESDVWTFFAWHWYLDHTLVLLSLADAALRTIPGLGRLSRYAIRRSLLLLGKRADRQGDARVLAHVQKELQAHGHTSDALLKLAVSAYELVTDPLNRALINRNAGDAAYSKGDIERAIDRYKAVLVDARACRSAATALKAYVGLYVCGEKISESDLQSDCGGLTGVGYLAFFAKFRRAITRARQ